MPAQPVLSLNPPVLHGGAGDDRMTKQSDHQIGLRRCPARIGRIGWLAVATQVIENPRNHCRFLDTGDHPQLPATAPTDLDVDRGKPARASRADSERGKSARAARAQAASERVTRRLRAVAKLAKRKKR